MCGMGTGPEARREALDSSLCYCLSWGRGLASVQLCEMGTIRCPARAVRPPGTTRLLYKGQVVVLSKELGAVRGDPQAWRAHWSTTGDQQMARRTESKRMPAGRGQCLRRAPRAGPGWVGVDTGLPPAGLGEVGLEQLKPHAFCRHLLLMSPGTGATLLRPTPSPSPSPLGRGSQVTQGGDQAPSLLARPFWQRQSPGPRAAWWAP